MSAYGFVYVLSNPAMPGIYKVGMTTRSPSQRAAELSNSTGVPAEFSIVYYAEVADPAAVESAVHDRLAGYRVNPCREFFRPQFLGEILNIIHHEYSINAVMTAHGEALINGEGGNVRRRLSVIEGGRHE